MAEPQPPTADAAPVLSMPESSQTLTDARHPCANIFRQMWGWHPADRVLQRPIRPNMAALHPQTHIYMDSESMPHIFVQCSVADAGWAWFARVWHRVQDSYKPTYTSATLCH